MAGGNVSEACEMLRQKYGHKVGRYTVYNAIRDNPKVKETFDQCQGATFDVCYRGMVKRAEKGNARDQRILFGRLAASHGGLPNTQKIELTGADGKPVQHEVIANGESTRQLISKLSDEDLDAYLAAVRIINGTTNKPSDKK